MNQKKSKSKTTKKKGLDKPKDKHDYQLMEATYIVTENIKIKDFAKQFNISPQNLYRVRKLYNWDEKKAAFHRSVADKVIEKAKEEQIVNYLDIRKSLDTSISEMTKFIANIITDPEQFFLQYTSGYERINGRKDTIKTDLVDTKRVELCVRALNTLTQIVNQRLQLDEGIDNTDDKVVINFIEGSEEYSK